MFNTVPNTKSNPIFSSYSVKDANFNENMDEYVKAPNDIYIEEQIKKAKTEAPKTDINKNAMDKIEELPAFLKEEFEYVNKKPKWLVELEKNVATQEDIEEWKKEGSMGIGDVAKQGKKWGYMIPFAGSSAETTMIVRNANTLRRLKNGEEVSNVDAELLYDFLREEKEKEVRGVTFAGKTLDGIRTGLGYLAEFGLGLAAVGADGIGLAAIGKTLSEIGAKKAARKAVEAALKEAAIKSAAPAAVKTTVPLSAAKKIYKDTLVKTTGAKALTNVGLKEAARETTKGLPKAIGTSAAFGNTVMLPHTINEIASKQLATGIYITDFGDAVLTDSENLALSVMKAIGSSTFETLTETAGWTFLPIASYFAKPVQRVLPKKFFTEFDKLVSSRYGMAASEALRKYGYDGILEEMGEEVLNRFLCQVFGINGLDEYNFEGFMNNVLYANDLSQWGVEALSFAAVGGGARLAAGAASKVSDEWKEKQYKKDVAKIAAKANSLEKFYLEQGMIKIEGSQSLAEQRLREVWNEQNVDENLQNEVLKNMSETEIRSELKKAIEEKAENQAPEEAAEKIEKDLTKKFMDNKIFAKEKDAKTVAALFTAPLQKLSETTGISLEELMQEEMPEIQREAEQSARDNGRYIHTDGRIEEIFKELDELPADYSDMEYLEHLVQEVDILSKIRDGILTDEDFAAANTLVNEAEAADYIELAQELRELSNYKFESNEDYMKRTEGKENASAQIIRKGEEIAPSDNADKNLIDNFGMSAAELTEMVKADIENILVESGVEEDEFKLEDIRVYGSYTSNKNKETSDLDFIVQYSGSMREDDAFNMLHADGLSIEDKNGREVTIDINPVNPAISGTIEDHIGQNKENSKETKLGFDEIIEAQAAQQELIFQEESVTEQNIQEEIKQSYDKTEIEEEKIDNTENNEAISDAGDALLGNLKKNKKQYTWDELDNMNDLLRKKYLSKAYIYQLPSVEELRKENLSDRTIAFIYLVHSKINAKPSKHLNDKKEDQKIYFNAVHEIMEKTINFAKENNDLIKDYSRTSAKNKELFDAIFPDYENKKPYNVFTAYPDLNRKAIIVGGNKLIDVLHLGYNTEKDIDKALLLVNKEKDVKTKKEDNLEGWEKQFTVTETYRGWCVADKKSGMIISSRDLPTKEIAEEIAKQMYDYVKKNNSSFTVNFNDLRDYIPRRENNQNVKPEALIEVFGFRGINFGNWTKQSERQDFLNSAYDALFDLAELLNLPPKALSLDGKLGLAFGAQGRSKAAGHFIPEYNEINLTRKSGAGALAHEWWHALDYYFGDQSLGKDFSGRSILGSTSQGELRIEVFDALKKLDDVIKYSPLSEKEVAEKAETIEKGSRRNLEYYANDIKRSFAKSKKADKIAAFVDNIVKNAEKIDVKNDQELQKEYVELLDERRRTWENIGKLSSLLFQCKKLQQVKELAAASKKYSKFYENAKLLNTYEKGMGSAYWTSSTELGARAFSSYILDKTAKQNFKSNFLVRDEKGEYSFNFEVIAKKLEAHQKGEEYAEDEKSIIEWYPAEPDERKRIFAALDELFRTIKYEKTDRGYKLYQGAQTNYKEQLEEIKGNIEYKKFVHKVLSGELSQKEKSKPLYIGKTPAKLIEAGLPENNISIGYKIIEKAQDNRNADHNLSEKTISEVWSALRNPIAVIKAEQNKNETGGNNRYSVILDLQNENGHYILVALEVNKKTGNSIVNDIRSIHSRKNYQPIIDKAFNDKRLLKVDAEKIKDLLTSQQPDIISGGAASLIDKIYQQQNNVKLYQSVNTAGAKGSAETSAAKKEWKEKGTESSYFKKWFGNSKVVDRFGNPISVFHGTENNFKIFKNLGKSRQIGANVGFFFTDSKNMAKKYADDKRVMEVYLSLQNPLIVEPNSVIEIFNEEIEITDTFDFFTQLDTKKSEQEIKEELLKQGYDGIILRNTNVDTRSIEEVHDVYIAFENTQIKSVNNQGTFDTDNPNIYYQSKEEDDAAQANLFYDNITPRKLRNMNIKGAFVPAENLIELFKNADESTIIHEFAHWWLSRLEKYAENNEELALDLAAVRKFVKNDGGKFTREQHEKFAVGFEAYIRNGSARNNRLKRIFEDFKNALIQIYDSIKWLIYTENGNEYSFTEDDVANLERLFERLLTTENERIKKTVFDRCDDINERIKEIKARQEEEMKELDEIWKDNIAANNRASDKKRKVSEYLELAETAVSRVPKEVKEMKQRYKDVTLSILSVATGMKKNVIANPRNWEKVQAAFEGTDRITASDGMHPEWLEFYSDTGVSYDNDEVGGDNELAQQAYEVMVDGTYNFGNMNEDDIGRFYGKFEYLYNKVQSLKGEEKAVAFEALCSLFGDMPEMPDEVTADIVEKLGKVETEYEEGQKEDFNRKRYPSIPVVQQLQFYVTNKLSELKVYDPNVRYKVRISKSHSLYKAIKHATSVNSAKKIVRKINEYVISDLENQAKTILHKEIQKQVRVNSKLVKIGSISKGKFDWKTNTIFAELVEINKYKQKEAFKEFSAMLELDKAAAGEDRESNDENPISTPEMKTDFQSNLKRKFLEYRSSKIKDLNLLATRSLLEDIMTLKFEGRRAKDAYELEKQLQKDNMKTDLVERVRELKDKRAAKQIAKFVMGGSIVTSEKTLVNWETALNALFGKEVSQRYSLLKLESDAEVYAYKHYSEFCKKAIEIYGLNNAANFREKAWNKFNEFVDFANNQPLVNLLQEYEEEVYNYKEVTYSKETGKFIETGVQLSRAEIITLYAWSMNEELEQRLFTQYGLHQVQHMFEQVLSEEDKQFAWLLIDTCEAMYEDNNEVFIRTMGLSLPKVENYFPSKTVRVGSEIDMLHENVVRSSNPSFIKQRKTCSRIKMKPEQPLSILLPHINKTARYVILSERLNYLNAIFKDGTVRAAIKEVFDGVETPDKVQAGAKVKGKKNKKQRTVGDRIHDALLNQLGSSTFENYVRGINVGKSFMDYVATNYITSRIGGNFKVMFGQLTSMVNYCENMPTGLWAKGFAECLKHPKETIKFMFENCDYLKARLAGNSMNEVMLKITDEADRFRSLRNFCTTNTKYGDLFAIAFGGKPYVDYLISQGLSKEEAIQKFVEDTMRSQQAGQASATSVWQKKQSEHPLTRMIFAFNNTTLQYERKFVDAMASKARGDISTKEFVKALLIYKVFNPILFTTFLTNLSFMNLIRGLMGDDEDGVEKFGIDVISSILFANLAAYGYLGMGLSTICSFAMTLVDKKEYKPFLKTVPIIGDLEEIGRNILLKNEVTVGDWVDAMALVTDDLTGIPATRFVNSATGLGDMAQGDFGVGALKMFGYGNYRANVAATGNPPNKKKK